MSDVESPARAAKPAPTTVWGTNDRPLSISDFTDRVKELLESTFEQVILIGEISNFKAHPSGHYYFSLKDDRAQISGVMFRFENAKLKFQPADGQKVIVVGRMTVYPPRGNYQIRVFRMEPDGIGSLQLAFEQLKTKLQNEGLFREERKQKIPQFPKKIGIVTSISGAAIRDILNVLDRRFAGLHVLIMPVKVQGEGAAEEIAQGIADLNQCFPDIDVMIVGRGGGSIEDLWAFNEEVVARAIFSSQIPVISAVGHEVDFTIADFVADVRAPTPSAAAELIVGSKVELLQHLDHLTNRLSKAMQHIGWKGVRVDELVQRLVRVFLVRWHHLRIQLEEFRGRLNGLSPYERLRHSKHRLKVATERIFLRIPRLMEEKKSRIESLQNQLRVLNPRSIMERGYSIVRNAETSRVLTKASDVRMGDKLVIEFSKGKITAKV